MSKIDYDSESHKAKLQKKYPDIEPKLWGLSFKTPDKKDIAIERFKKDYLEAQPDAEEWEIATFIALPSKECQVQETVIFGYIP